jgi:hypothetical protein|uniref:Uncharacterized protein n=1 Tax=Zea mays TaxID=4577 RepID=C0PLX1_MAIZE|nr:unknown [Zea mays]
MISGRSLVRRAEGDVIAGRSGAGEGAGGVVVGVAVGRRACALEHLRVVGRAAHRRRAVLPGAAVARAAVGDARALARYDAAAGRCDDAEVPGAHGVYVARASRGAAVAAAARGRHAHRHVEAVDEADVVEVRPAAARRGERDLDERDRRRRPAALARDVARAAVGRGAGEAPGGGVGHAARARPQRAGPCPRRRRVHAGRGGRRQVEARPRERRRAGAVERAHPHRVLAGVGEDERRRSIHA